MCGYGNRVPEGWHRISDEMIVRDGEPRVTGEVEGIQIVSMPPLIWEPARPFIPDYEGKEADEKILAEIAAKPEEMYGSY